MSQELIGIIAATIALAGLLLAGHSGLSSDIGDLGEQVRDLGERITRVETVIDERLPRAPVQLASESTELPHQ